MAPDVYGALPLEGRHGASLVTQRPVFLDFETRSLADLRKVGGHAYVAHPSTEVVCGAAILPNGERWVWSRWPFLEPKGASRGSEETPPPPVVDAALQAGAAAHNAEGFDRLVWEALGMPEVEWLDTAHLCAQAGLPRKLESATQATLGEGKDKAGAKLMRHISFPKAGALRDPVPALLTPFVRYCLRDTELLVRLWDQEHLPALAAAHVDAGALLALDATINRRGVAVDLDWLAELRRVNAEASEWALAQAARWIEGDPGAALRSPQKLARLLARHGEPVPDCRASTMQHLLLHEAPAVRALAAARLAVARVLRGKLDALERFASADGRVRGTFVYHSAHTGRWGNTGPQLHNLPRVPKGADGLRPSDAPAWAEEKGVPVQDVLGALIRGSLVPDPGYIFVSGDFSAVEARGVLWHAEDPLLAEFAASDQDKSAPDPYMREAGRLVGRPVLTRDDPLRQLGKICVLSLGYSGGANALERSAAKQRIDFAGIKPQDAVESWRDAHPAVAGRRTGGVFPRADGTQVVVRRGGWWYLLKRALRRCILNGGVRRAGRVTFERDGAHVALHLPSGRRMLYRECRMEKLLPPWGGEPKWHPVWQSPRGMKKLWQGTLAENVTQAACRDLLCAAMLRLEEAGFPVSLHVHDSVTVQAKPGDRDRVRELLCVAPAWAAGFPVAADVTESERFLK